MILILTIITELTTANTLAFDRRCIRSSFVAQVRRTLPVRLHLRALLARRIDALDASGYLRVAAPGMLSASSLPPSIAKRSRVWFERPRQRLEEDSEEERGEPEQKPQKVESAVPDDEVDHPDQPEELQRVLDDEPLVDRPAVRERLLQDLPYKEEVPARDDGAARRRKKHRDVRRSRRDRDPDSPEDHPRGEKDPVR